MNGLKKLAIKYSEGSDNERFNIVASVIIYGLLILCALFFFVTLFAVEPIAMSVLVGAIFLIWLFFTWLNHYGKAQKKKDEPDGL